MVSDAQTFVMREVTGAEISAFVHSAGRYGGTAQEIARIIEEDRHFILSFGGVDVLGYSVQVNGDEFFVSAAAGRSKIDLFKLWDEVASLQAVGFKSIAFKTIRRGLVRKSTAAGYVQCKNNVMRKKI